MTESPPPPRSVAPHVSSVPTDSENTLSSFRAQIDALDTQILSLLNQRILLVEKIGKLKKKERLPVYSPGREEQLLRRLGKQNQGPLSAEAIRAIYREILSASRATEKEMIIACLISTEGGYYQAATDQFGSSAKYVFFKDAADIFKQISENKVDYGVFPIEQPELKGDVLNGLMQTDLPVCARILPSSDFLQGKKGSVGFLVVGKVLSPPSGFDHTLMVLRVEESPNALANTLELLKKNQFSHLGSWSVAKNSKDIFFLVEVEGHFNQLQANGLLRKLSQHCRAVKVLGSYPQGKLAK